MEKLNKIPRLRFQEYKVEGEWKLKIIKNEIDFLSGYPFKSEDISEETVGLPLLRGVNITEGCIRHSNEIDRYYNGDITKIAKYFLKEGDLVIGMDGSKVGKNSAIIDSNNANSILVQRVARLREKKDSCVKFIYQHINSIRFHKYVDEVKTSSGIPHISSSQIEGFKIYFPSLSEQKKIASFLSSIDDRLTNLKQKKLLLERYKNGLMQKIFNQEIRFKDDNGNDFPEWEERTLGEIAKKKIIKNKYNKVTNVFTNSASLGIVNQRDFFDKDIANQNNLLNYYIVDNNDFVYNPRISNLAPVGPISRNHLQTGVMSPLYSVFAITNGNLDFYEVYFSSDCWHDYMKGIANYGARADRMSISTNDFYSMPLPFPCIAEQTKIANFLSAIDEKINGCHNQIEKTEQYKKGLLQQMFC